jgi:hypothetical protein
MILVASASPLGAQTLDIGGIELRLGESGTTALADLRSAYDVRYEESIGMWSIFRKRVADDPYVFVGQVYIKAGVVSRIVKDYELTDQYDLVDVYSTAMKQVRKRGGATCNTWPQEMTDGRFWSIHTTCGSYELTLNLPNRLHGQASGDNRASAGVSATVPKWP